MISRLIALVLLLLAPLPTDVTASDGLPAAASADTTIPAGDSTPESTLNPLMPDRENVTECFGGVPRPDCGSDARGGWRQGVVFGVVAAAIVVIGVRLALGVRRRANPSG